MSYPPPPSSPSGKPRLRGRIPLRLALIFGVVGIAGVIIGAVLLTNALSVVDDFTRVPLAAGSKTVTLDAGKYVGYYEAAGKGRDGGGVFVQMAIADADTGDEVSIGLYGKNGTSTSTLTYDRNGKHGEALFKFNIDKSGSYTVQVEDTDSNAPADADIALGESIAGKFVGGTLTLVGGVLFVIPAIVLLIVGLVKRSNHKKELANASAYGYPPPPPPGYGPQQSGPWPPAGS